MNKSLLNILDYISEGIVILDEKLEILFWNKRMEELVGIKKDEAHNQNIFKTIPKLDKIYFRKAFETAIKKDYKYFFSSKLHKNMLSDDFEINLKVNKFKDNGSNYLMIEFVDITGQCVRIKQLKENVSELFSLNKKLQEKEIERLAYYDRLTNVGNRSLFYSLGEKLLASAKRNNTILGLMFIDIDRFKDINDEYGHLVGDKVLVEVAQILTESVREADTVARHGGDEFLVLLPELKDCSNYEVIAERIANASKRVKINENLEIDICFSIGVSFYPQDGTTLDELISKADKAMYNVKKMGGNRCAHYNSHFSTIL